MLTLSHLLVNLWEHLCTHLDHVRFVNNSKGYDLNGMRIRVVVEYDNNETKQKTMKHQNNTNNNSGPKRTILNYNEDVEEEKLKI